MVFYPRVRGSRQAVIALCKVATASARTGPPPATFSTPRPGVYQPGTHEKVNPMITSRNHRRSCGALKAAAALLLAAAGCSALAATYYVDADNGNDANDGLAAAATNAFNLGRGAWQTLARVSAAPLVAGDQVLLRCGQTWREPLVLNRGGSVGLPVTIGAYPYDCANQPVIGGYLTPQDDEWDLVNGNIYKVKLPLSVLPNGRMKTGLSGWRLHSGTPGASMSFRASCNDGMPCSEFLSGESGGLLISPAMTLIKRKTYTVRYSIWAPVGAVYGATVRRFQAPYNQQSPYQTSVGTGSWQTKSFSFVAPITLSDARLDIDMPGGGRATYFRDLRVEPDMTGQEVLHVGSNAGVMNLAAHPNRGYNPALPNSAYLPTGVSTSTRGTDGRIGSAYIKPLNDHLLPSGVVLTPGLDVWVRSQAWSVRKMKVSSVIGNLVYTEGLTPYPLNYAGWGYFFTGAAWMLDAPGEWFYDRTTREFSVWMPDGAAPGQRIALGVVPRAVTIGNPGNGTFVNNITLENLAFIGSAEGLAIDRMQNITLRKVRVEDIGSWGVIGDGANGLRVENSVFKRTRADAILVNGATDVKILNNDISESGVLIDASGLVRSLPRENFAAVHTGARALVANNVISNVGYIGMLAMTDSTIRDNVLNNFALTLNDAGGIYGAGAARATVTGNLIRNGFGDRNGIPSVIQSVVAGIYLDGNADAYVVSGNAFVGNDYCLQMHDSYNSTFESNTCFGHRRSAVWLQESSTALRTQGDTFNNRIVGNSLFQTASGPTFTLNSSRTTVDDFAFIDGNRYSTLASPIAAQESSPGFQRSYTLVEWKLATTAAGPRGVESTGFVAAPVRNFARGLLGSNLIPSLLVSGWSLSGGGTSVIAPNCGPNATPCFIYTAPSSVTGYISSQRFSVVKGRSYRVSFDAKVSDPSMSVDLMAMRSGPTYENLMGLNFFSYSGGTSWKRYSFTFQATSDALVSPNSAGARIDFMNVKAGGQLSLANFALNELTTPGGEAYSTMLSNPGRMTDSFACPLVGVQCGKFVDFPTGQRVTWPVLLDPRATKIVFTQDESLADTDGDGVADSQDRCPSTPVDQIVDAAGCSIGQP
jgi:parallel beta-helix repeat protein